ncbi:hypothetical protein [Pseudomonas sp. R76]|uniref:hypothetical protein n=1 Tax=Pseudomonas sp. R76 TaxID=1573711 RepID=UPI0013593574|nr:hypothetical protein [Pseudomonas sp. R76]
MEWVKNIIIKMTEDIFIDDSEVGEKIDFLKKSLNPATRNLQCDENRFAINCIGKLLHSLAENKYGPSSMDAKKISTQPRFHGSRSRVGVTLSTPEFPDVVHMVCLGSTVKSWEQLFYEVAHESLHLLGPADINSTPVATLEEGAAVKFAESFYAEYIFPEIGAPPPFSPLSSPGSVYYRAYQCAKKIPDETLKKIRQKFKNFREVEYEGLQELAKNFITEEEIKVLVSPFDYKAY